MKLPDSYKDAWKASQERIRELELNMKTERKLHKLEIDELRELLRRATTGQDYCFICGKYLIPPMVKQDMRVGHNPDCELVKELADALR